VETLYDRIKLLQLFINNQSINHPTAYQSLLPLRLLFRHSDDLLYDLQKRLSSEILTSPTQPFNHFLAQDAEKTLNSLLSLQVLLEIRARLEKAEIKLQSKPLAKHQEIIEKETVWLKKEIHSRVPSTQRNIKIHEPIKLSRLNKWHIPKKSFGYDTGPDSIWYFFQGETRLIVFIQREFLNLISMAFNFRDWVDNIAKNKESMQKILLYFFMVNFIFAVQLINLAFLPYRLLRTILAEVNQLVYHFVRRVYEYCWPIQHTNKPLLHFASLSIQFMLYAALLLNLNLSYLWLAPMLVINSGQIGFVTSLFLVLFNSAALIMGLGHKLENRQHKKENPNTLNLSKALTNSEATQPKKTLCSSKFKQVYLPLLMQLKLDLPKHTKNHLPKASCIEPQLKNKSFHKIC
jgi:hypothetical protein